MDDLYEALCAIAQALHVPRNRFGKLESSPITSDHIRQLAVKYKVGGCQDVAEQCQRVAAVVTRKHIEAGLG